MEKDLSLSPRVSNILEMFRIGNDIRFLVIPRHEGSLEVLFMLILSFKDPREMLPNVSMTAVLIYVIGIPIAIGREV